MFIKQRTQKLNESGNKLLNVCRKEVKNAEDISLRIVSQFKRDDEKLKCALYNVN